MKTPMILPWLAHRAGISDRRAEELWQGACLHAGVLTGEHETSRYWGVAKQNFVDRLAAERWCATLPVAWPWLPRESDALRWSMLTLRALAPFAVAMAVAPEARAGFLPGVYPGWGPIARVPQLACPTAAVLVSFLLPWLLWRVHELTATGRSR